MMFTVTVDMNDNGYFEFSSKSIFKVVEIASMFGNLEVDDEDDEFFDVPDEIAHYFDSSEEYIYDEEKDCYCWYDEEHEAWYWLDVETGEWLLVEDIEGYEVESE